MARPRSGTLEWRNDRWFARLHVTVDGFETRKRYDLKTTNKSQARRRMAQLVKDTVVAAPTEQAAAAPETVDSFAKGWIEARRARGIAAAEYEERFYWRVWSPVIGKKALGEVTAADVRGVLEDAATGALRPVKRKHHKNEPGPYSHQSIAHMRATAFRLFDAAWRDELIPENRVARVSVPEIEEESKPRTTLTDAEIGALLAHPEVDGEIKMLVLLSRTVAGLRAGDLNALDWTAFSPGFGTCTFVRRKTRRKKPQPVTFQVPAPVVAFLTAWHVRQGAPDAGPVFPVRRGPRAGESKAQANMSYATRLRRELLRAGITRHELHHETPTTLPVHFHATRSAYAKALARANVNEQTAMALTGHSDSKVHKRYLESQEVRVLPSAAVPYVDPAAAALVANRTQRGTKPAASNVSANDQSPLQPVGIAVGSDHQAGLAQLVEHELPKLGVTGSSPVSRSVWRRHDDAAQGARRGADFVLRDC
jgi:integrase